MASYIAKRVRFRNGERTSVLMRPHGLPVHEVTLYLDSLRRRGRAANTIHLVCCAMVLLYRELARANVDVMDRFQEGRFLTVHEMNRLASLAQLRMEDTDDDIVRGVRTNVVNIARISFRAKAAKVKRRPVNVGTQATRLRYIAGFLEFASRYVASTLPVDLRARLDQQSAEALASFRAEIPAVSKRANLGARVGLSQEEQARLVCVVDPASTDNPWSQGFVRRRNWIMVMLLLATGMRRGELLGLQIQDLSSQEPKLRILRRADVAEDSRTLQPNTKTKDREIELSPSIMRVLWAHINKDRRAIRAARKVPQVFVSDEGNALSIASIDKIFFQIRSACPGLPVVLTSHVMRHTWNERFSEYADSVGLSDVEEQQARNQQQGWSENSNSAATYTRRHTAKMGNQISLRLQELLDVQLPDGA